jgi:hypothetical protein
MVTIPGIVIFIHSSSIVLELNSAATNPRLKESNQQLDSQANSISHFEKKSSKCSAFPCRVSHKATCEVESIKSSCNIISLPDKFSIASSGFPVIRKVNQWSKANTRSRNIVPSTLIGRGLPENWQHTVSIAGRVRVHLSIPWAMRLVISIPHSHQSFQEPRDWHIVEPYQYLQAQYL